MKAHEWKRVRITIDTNKDHWYYGKIGEMFLVHPKARERMFIVCEGVYKKHGISVNDCEKVVL